MQQLKIGRRLFVAGVLAATSLGRVAAQSAPRADFATHYRALLSRFQAAHPGLISDFRIIRLAGNARPWIDAELSLTAGDHVSLLADGQVYLDRAANMALLPRVVLWGRVGDADIFQPGSDTYSFSAANDGPLQLATLQVRWATPRGDHPSPAAYDTIEGGIDVLVIRWRTREAQHGIAKLAAFAPDDALLASELKRLAAPRVLPQGFEPLWYVGSGGNFSQTVIDGAPAIAIRSELDAGIIRAPLDLPLEEGIRVAWEWRVNQLPSVRAEDAIPFHQYASIAVEFDDGQDLSWYWSAAIEPEKHYRCPFPTWPGETHLVVRSGSQDQGSWLRESRDLHVDVTAALPRRPARIRGIWLIASTVFGARPASVDFRKITVIGPQGREQVIFPA